MNSNFIPPVYLYLNDLERLFSAPTDAKNKEIQTLYTTTASIHVVLKRKSDSDIDDNKNNDSNFDANENPHDAKQNHSSRLDNIFNNNCLNFIGQCQSLREILFGSNYPFEITPHQAKKIASVISQNPHINSVSFINRNFVCKQATKIIIDAIPILKNVRGSMEHLEKDFFLPLLKPTLQSFFVGFGWRGADPITLLTEGLPSTMRRLSLDRIDSFFNKNYNKHMKDLLIKITHSMRLTMLSITDSGLTDDLMPHIVTLILQMETLIYLDLSKNNFTTIGVNLLCEGLKHRKTIISVIFDDAPITPKIVDCLVKKSNILCFSLSSQTYDRKNATEQERAEIMKLNGLAGYNYMKHSRNLQDQALNELANELKIITRLLSDISRTIADYSGLSRGYIDWGLCAAVYDYTLYNLKKTPFSAVKSSRYLNEYISLYIKEAGIRILASTKTILPEDFNRDAFPSVCITSICSLIKSMQDCINQEKSPEVRRELETRLSEIQNNFYFATEIDFTKEIDNQQYLTDEKFFKYLAYTEEKLSAIEKADTQSQLKIASTTTTTAAAGTAANVGASPFTLFSPIAAQTATGAGAASIKRKREEEIENISATAASATDSSAESNKKESPAKKLKSGS